MPITFASLSTVGPSLRVEGLDVDGWIESVRLFDGETLVADNVFDPVVVWPSRRPAVVPLSQPLPNKPHLGVEVSYRANQPLVGPGPLRQLFVADVPRTDKDHSLMNDHATSQSTDPSNETISPTLDVDRSADRHEFILATIDFGTSRSVGAVYDIKRLELDPTKPISEEAANRAWRVLGAPAENDAAAALAIDYETEYSPSARRRAWEAAFSAPPLDSQCLKLLKELNSDLVIAPDGSIDFQAERSHGSESVILRGVKRLLVQPDHLIKAADRSAEDVIADAIARLSDLTSIEAEGGEDGGGEARPFARLHLTYPTKLPTDRRDALRDRVEAADHLVFMRVDEAAGAAGFRIMAHFGDDAHLGVEAFKAVARSHTGERAWENPDAWTEARSWHENWLVVDVGGGTTDCAVVRLTLLDVTPPDVAPGRGRFHRIQPRVVASGGIINLGGDQITKRLFSLLKSRFGLEGETRFQGTQDDKVHGERQRNFSRLWAAAELVKAQGGVRGLRDVDVMVEPAGASSDPAWLDNGIVRIEAIEMPAGSSISVTTSTTTVTAEDLTSAVESTVDQVAALAAGIARAGSEAVGGEQIDRVAFSGGSMLSDYLRDRIEQALRQQMADDKTGAGFVVDFDGEYCKSGTALGAMYFNSMQNFASDPVDRIDDLEAGRDFLDVDVSRMHANLAADFTLHVEGAIDSEGDELFIRGQRLTMGPGGLRRARSRPQSYRELLNVHRRDFDVQTRKPSSSGDALTVGLRWWASGGDLGVASPKEFLQTHNLSLVFEIDEMERISLLIIKGAAEPAPDLEGGTVIADDLGGPVIEDGLTKVAIFDDLVNPGMGTLHDTEPVIAVGQQVGAGLVVEVSGLHLWYRRDGSKAYEELVKLPNDGRWLSIGPDGTLRCHSSYPEDVEVAAVEDLATAPDGATYRTAMKSGGGYDSNEDPFNGTL